MQPKLPNFEQILLSLVKPQLKKVESKQLFKQKAQHNSL